MPQGANCGNTTDPMDQNTTPFTVEIYDDTITTGLAAFFRGPVQLLVAMAILPFLVFAAGDVSPFLKIIVSVVCWGGAIFYAIKHIPSASPKPVFAADRTGFRIRGGRLRPWETFLGAHIERHVVRHEEVQSFRVQLMGQSFEGATRVGTYAQYGGADRAVQRILEFKRVIEAARAAEAGNFALGPAPVVAARAKREGAGRAVTVLERLGFIFGRY